MPGSCEADKSASSSLISSLRSYRLKERPKSQIPARPSSSSSNSDTTSNNIASLNTTPVNDNSSSSESSFQFNILRDTSQATSSTKKKPSNSKPQSYNPLSYRKYEISHTSQFILPCILNKFQQTFRREHSALQHLTIKLTEEEYVKLKELILKQSSLGEKWNSNVIENSSYITCGFRELKISRPYLIEIRKVVRQSYTANKSDERVDSISVATTESRVALPVRTYSRTKKIIKVETPKVEIPSQPDIVDNTVSTAPQTKGIMDEYEVFCEKEQNLRKLLDAFPGADIMEAQDILVKCNWDLDEAIKIAQAQPLRCNKKKALQYINATSSESVPVQLNVDINSKPQSTPSAMSNHTVTEEITLDSSDDESFANALAEMNSKRRNDSDTLPAAKKSRRMLSSSDSEADTSNSSNLQIVTEENSILKNENSNAYFISSAMEIKAVTTESNIPEKPKQTSSVSTMPNLPKGLVITQLGNSASAKSPASDSSDNSSKVSTVNLVNKKAEVITIPSQTSAQLVRLQSSSNNGIDKPDPGYTIHKTGSVVSLPSVNKGMSITPVPEPSVIKPNGKTSFEPEIESVRSKSSKSKRKKYAPSEDEDDDYGNEDIYDSDASDIEENLTSAHSAVLKFFQESSIEELGSIPGCSKKRIEGILNLRPFSSWVDLVQKLGSDKYLSTDLLNGAKKVLDMRNAINKLMAKCQQISLDMEDLVENLKESRETSSDYVDKQPNLLNDKMHLASYQMLGLNWLLLLHNQEVNGILADEMGLGKTVQAIAFLAYLKQIGTSGPHLIVVPSSTLDNWKQELHTWWPTVSTLVYHGSQEGRRELRLQILNDEVEDFDVMVTTYNMVTSSAEDRTFFKRLEFHYVVFDEAHMLKNMSSQRYQHLMKIKAPRRLLLTGTPLQNNLVELMSLLIFAMPHMFSGKTEQVKQMFTAVSKADGNKNSYEKDRIDHAKRIMKPFVLRRLKKEVLKDLPAKHDETRKVPMIETQAEKYKNLVDKFSAEMRNNKEDSSEKISSSGAGMMMQLRRAANHPLLLRHFYNDDKLTEMSNDILKEPTHVNADPNLVFEDMSIMSDFELYKLCKQFKSLNSYIIPTEYILNSGKFKMLDELLPDLIEKDHRILLFSQFTMVLDIIQEYMQIKDYKYLRLDGQTPVHERQDMIDEFNNDPSITVFLLSTRAGGLGINLTAADTVILHDIDFNPYNDKQAEDRCHRVGQIRDVRVIRFISENTIEEGILHSAKEKLKLERDIHDENEAEESDSASVAKLLRDALGLKTTKS